MSRQQTPNRDLQADTARENLLTNGGFEIWQRGALTFTASGAYCADRWSLNIGGTGTLSVTRNSVNQDIASTYCAAVVYVAGSAANAIDQGVEINGPGLRGKTVTFSIRVNAPVVGGIHLRLVDVDGSTLVDGAANVSTGTYETLSVTMPLTATNAGGKIVCRIRFNTGAMSGTYYIDNAMLVVGTVPADYAPLHPADDLARCMRYYQKWTVTGGGRFFCPGLAYGTTNAFLMLPVKAPFGGTPTVSFSAVGDFQVANSSAAGIGCTGLTVSGVASEPSVMIGITATVASGLVAGNASGLMSAVGAAAIMAEWNP